MTKIRIAQEFLIRKVKTIKAMTVTILMIPITVIKDINKSNNNSQANSNTGNKVNKNSKKQSY